MTVLISPSDFAFLYDQSKWGFYNKYKNGIKRPTVIMPKIFTLIDHSFKESFLNQNLYSICKDLPDATFRDADKWVVSKEISNPSIEVPLMSPKMVLCCLLAIAYNCSIFGCIVPI